MMMMTINDVGCLQHLPAIAHCFHQVYGRLQYKLYFISVKSLAETVGLTVLVRSLQLVEVFDHKYRRKICTTK